MTQRPPDRLPPPIAIIGTALRLPGDLSDETAFWQALLEGRDQVSEISAERWQVDELRHPTRGEPGRSITFAAGVLSRVEEFDAAFFGISPREAAWMDPQQRLLLELAWEAMENAGCPPSRLAGSRCAVYVGISGFDYGMRRLDDLSSMTAHTMTGNTLSIAANRLSYVFDLRGPSLAVDTACSSSLVALHHACNAIAQGEASCALVGGVNLLMHPYPFVGFTKASMLSEHGRCASFDAAGDGYVRSEGAVVLLLKPLAQALADGDPIEAVIRATGVNADGARKTGITIPSSEGQTELMRAVLARSGLEAGDLDYLEAHGTGTMVGDPIESAAIGAVYGLARDPGDPLPIGSVKSNLGHLEPASGLAGLMKALLVLKHGVVPPTIHLQQRNPRIDFAGLRLDPVATPRALARRVVDGQALPLRAGVNSFGFGGANAHVLLEGAPARAADSRPPTSGPLPLILSAASPDALPELAARYAATLRACAGDRAAMRAVVRAAALDRDWLDHRLAIAAADPELQLGTLDRFAAQRQAAGAVEEHALPGGSEVAFIYSGNGAQWVGMGLALLAGSAEFSAQLGELDVAIAREAGFSILEELRKDESASRLHDTAVAQPLLFALQVVVTRMLLARGVRPAAVLGHSVGEVAAAWVSGALDLDQAIRVICARSAAQALTVGAGRMAAVSCTAPEAVAILAEAGAGAVEIAAYNAPAALTLSGPLDQLEAVQACCRRHGKAYKLLDLDYAFHNATMDGIRAPLLERLDGLVPAASHRLEFISTVRGEALAASALGAQYWWDNVRQPVRFQQAVESLIAGGCRILIEVGPHAILQRYLSEIATGSASKVRALPTLKRHDDAPERLEETALRALLLQGQGACAPLFGEPAARVRLPNYPWQRELHAAPATSEGGRLLSRHRVHPLLGWRLRDAEAAWENVIDLRTHAWLKDHAVAGAAVLPGAAYVELALAAAREWTGQAACRIENLDILAPLTLDGEHGRSLRVELHPRDQSFQVRSRQRLSEDPWIVHAVGRVAGKPAEVSRAVPASTRAGHSTIDHDTHYRLAASLGLDYGPAFRAFVRGMLDGDTLHGELDTSVDAGHEGMLLPPALLDACFQSLVAFFREDIEAGHGLPLLPVRVGELHFHGEGRINRFVTRLVRRSRRSVEASFVLADDSGRQLATLTGCRFRAAMLRGTREDLPACWEHVARLTPLASAQREACWPSTSHLTADLRNWLLENEGSLRRAAFHQEALPLFDALVVSAVYHGMRQFAVADPTGAQLLLDGVTAGEGPLAPFRHWLMALLQRQELVIEGSVGAELVDSDLPPPEEIWRTLLRDFPASIHELVLVGRVISHLPGLISGGADSDALAREIRDSQQRDRLYESSYAYAGGFQALAQLLTSLAGAHPTSRRLRILELAPGAGSLASTLAGHFDLERLDYVLAHPQGRNGDTPSHGDDPHRVPVTLVQLEADGQGFMANGAVTEQFDVIFVRHCLHGFDNPGRVLAWLRSRLAVGGLLAIAERNPDLAPEMCAGLDARWWRQGATGAAQSRLRTQRDWERLLEDQGYGEVAACLEYDSLEDLGGAFLLLAKHPGRAKDEPEAASRPHANWLFLSAGQRSLAVGRELCRCLGMHQQSASIADIGPGSGNSAGPDVRIAGATAAAVAQYGRIDHVVDLSALDKVSEQHLLVDTLGETHTEVALATVKALRASGTTARIWWILPGGAPINGLVGTARRNPKLAASWGFGRVVGNEWPEARATLIDTGDLIQTEQLSTALAAELIDGDDEREIVLTVAGRYGLRLTRAQLRRTGDRNDQSAVRYRLDFRSPGQLRNLVWDEMQGVTLGDDQVEVQPVAVGLNFRDVMYTMGLLPDEAVENGFSGASLGLEFAGVVSRVGKRVETAAVGDAVMGFGPACFASHIVTTASAITHKPEAWSFESAATVPTAFFTAYYALRHLANLQAGERVLIHGAAGAVGMAAVELARYFKAEVFATAGSDERRDFVHMLGADHIFDSRSPNFADGVLAATDGEGVDVILNSLAGEAVRRNLQILRPFGRFLELGKRDFFENTPIGLRPFRNNISYFGVDADQLLSSRPALAARIFREVMALFRSGVLSPLPYTAFTADQVVGAFRYMQQARQIGKVVVTMGERPGRIRCEQPRHDSLRFRKDRSYLVTGGLEGFGLETARWLASLGAGEIVLVGRRGVDTPGALQAATELRAQGARIHVAACDVSDPDAVTRLFRQIAHEHLPLAGIVHAAMQIDDSLFDGLDADRLRSVLLPKCTGAWNLHAASLDLPLEHFILYSSVTTAIGNPGQANYVAANCAVEALACLRQDMGLPATCIGWGPVEDVGYLARHAGVRDQLLNRMGVRALRSRTGLAILERLLQSRVCVTHVADLDWAGMARRLPAMKTSRLVALGAETASSVSVVDGPEAFRAMIVGKSLIEIRTVVTDLVTREVAQILAISPDRIDGSRLLQDMGLDSLMGVELGMALEKRFGIQLPAMLLSEGPSIERLSARVVELLSNGPDASEGGVEGELATLVTTLASQHGEQVSEDEIRATVAAVRQLG